MAVTKLNTFRSVIDSFCVTAENAMLDVGDIACGKILEELVKVSPVDTGRFRGNWQVTGNSPAERGYQDRYDPDGKTTIANGKARIGRILKQGEAVQSVWFSNILPYSNRLEYGWSRTQAPAGVIGVTQLKLGAILNEAVREARRRNGY